MPIYFKELEKVIKTWYNIRYLQKPTDSAAAWVSYKYMKINAKETLITDILKIFKNIEKNEITVVPEKNNFYINIKPKKQPSKL